MQFRDWLTLSEEADADIVRRLVQAIQHSHDPVAKAELDKLQHTAGSSGPPPTQSNAISRIKRGDATADQPFKDIISALRQREHITGLPLLDLFAAMLAGRDTAFKIARFGRTTVQSGHGIIVQTIEQSARLADDSELLRLLQKYKDASSTLPGRSQARYQPQQRRARQRRG